MAFSTKKPTDDFEINIDASRTCHHCGKHPARVIEDHDEGVLVCRDCGSVFREPLITYIEERRTIKNDDGAKEQDHTRTTANRSLLLDAGLGTQVGASTTRSYTTTMERRLAENKKRAMTPRDRMLSNGFSVIKMQVSELDLLHKFEDTALKIFRDFVQKGTVGGVDEGVSKEGLVKLRVSSHANTNMPEHAAMAIFFASKVLKNPIPIKELAKVLKIKPAKLRKAFKNMKPIAGNVQGSGVADYMERYASLVKFSTPMIGACKAAARRISNYDMLSGKRPQTLAAGIIFLISKETQFAVDPKDICNMTGVALTTLTATYKTLLDIKDDLLDEQFRYDASRGVYASASVAAAAAAAASSSAAPPTSSSVVL